MRNLIAYLTAATLICGCKTQPAFTPASNATVMLTAEAGVFMAILKKRDGIPDIPANRHRDLKSGMMCDPTPEAHFPFNAQFRAVMSDAPGTTYGFVVTKAGQSRPWAITKAWKEADGTKTNLALPSADLEHAANEELMRRKKEGR
jgi:hypothetical protein